MDCNTISTVDLAVNSGVQDIRDISSPGIPDSGYFINVNTKFCHIINVLFCRIAIDAQK